MCRFRRLRTPSPCLPPALVFLARVVCVDLLVVPVSLAFVSFSVWFASDFPVRACSSLDCQELHSALPSLFCMSLTALVSLCPTLFIAPLHGPRAVVVSKQTNWFRLRRHRPCGLEAVVLGTEIIQGASIALRSKSPPIPSCHGHGASSSISVQCQKLLLRQKVTPCLHHHAGVLTNKTPFRNNLSGP